MAPRDFNQKVAVAAVYVSGMFLAIMDSTIVNVALPTMGRAFHVRAAAVDAVVIGYLVSLAVFIPASGWLGDRLGLRRTMLAAIAVFTTASALCGVAGNLGELTFFRVLQGVGGGLMTPVGTTMLWRVFPPVERVRASAILVIPAAIAPALGPVVGGILVTDLSWRWVFYVNVPIGAAAIAFGLTCLHELPRQPSFRFDVRGFLLSASGFALLMYGLSEGPVRGWHSSDVVATCLVGVALVALLVMVELRTDSPLIDLRLYSNRLFRSATLTILGAGGASVGLLYAVTLFFQYGLGLSALHAGLNTFPQAVGMMLGTQAVSRLLYPAVGPRRLMTVGLLLTSVVLALMALIGVHTDPWLIRLMLFATGLFMSLAMVPSQVAAFATVSPERLGRASALTAAQRQLGGALGVALMTTVIAAVGTTHVAGGRNIPHLAAYHWAFIVAAVIAFASAAAAWTIHDEDAAHTMARRKVPAPSAQGDTEAEPVLA